VSSLISLFQNFYDSINDSNKDDEYFTVFIDVETIINVKLHMQCITFFNILYNTYVGCTVKI
jgi:hypothetical protein